MRPFQTLSAARDNFLRWSLHREIVLRETQLYIFNIIQNFLNTVGTTLFSMSKSTIDYIFSQEFQISFRLFEAKFIPRIYVKGKFSKEIWKGTRSNVLT